MNCTWNCLRQQRYEHNNYAIIPVQPAHIEVIRCWRNAQLDVLRQPAPISATQQEIYYATHIWPSMELEQPTNILMALLKDEDLIGYGGLVHVSWHDLRAELSFLIDDARAADPAQYKEDFTAFIYLARVMGFEDLDLHRIFTETYALRMNHINVLEGAGFQLEGVMRDHVRVGSGYVDSLIHSLLRK